MADCRRPLAARWLSLCGPGGLALALVGYFGPWLPHKTAALTVTGAELSEFAKFFPQVQSGAVPVTRQLFLTPLIAFAILLGLILMVDLPLKRRLFLVPVAALIALAALPPYQFLSDPQYRGQLALALGGAALVPGTLLAPRLPRRARGVLVLLVALGGTIPALWQFALLRPLVAALYGAPVGLGWGLILYGAGFALVLLWGVWRYASASASTRRT